MTTSSTKPVIVFTCGGTGGHVYPAISLAQELTQVESVFIGSKGRQDSRIIPKYDYRHIPIKSSRRNLLIIFLGYLQALRHLRSLKAKIVVSSGGYLTVPVVLAAFTLRIPIILIEQNVIPGKANVLLQRLATHICLSFEASKPYFKSKAIKVTGNPIRKSFEPKIKAESNDNKLDSLDLLVFGGSQAAESINRLIIPNYNYFITQGLIVVHLVGHTAFNTLVQNQSEISNGEALEFEVGLNEIKITSLKDSGRVLVYAYYEQMDELYKAAKLVICRAGATSIAEIINFGVKALLVPYPYAADQHQLANAKAFQETGSGRYIEQDKLTFETIQDTIQDAKSWKSPKAKQDNAREVIATLISDMVS